MNKTNLIVGISLAVFLVSIATIAGSMIVVSELRKEKVMGSQTVTTKDIKGLTMEEVGKHNTNKDCWLMISNKVYGVTAFIDQHPGGAAELAAFCGKDATEAFGSKGKTPASSHSNAAKTMLEQYFIGELGGDILPTKEQPTPTNTNPTNTPQPTMQPTIAKSQTLSWEEIAKHNTAADCWLVVSGQVYAVSSYISNHPGGKKEITAYCGKEATTAFQTQGGEGSHSSRAENILDGLRIGHI